MYLLMLESLQEFEYRTFSYHSIKIAKAGVSLKFLNAVKF